jgi:hypothetical protein
MIMASLVAEEAKATHIADITFQIVSPAGKQIFTSRCLEVPEKELRREKFQEWIDKNNDLLRRNEISVIITDFERWKLPSSNELHRLGRISGYRIPEVFGPTEGEQAFAKFSERDVPGCMDIFSRMLSDKESHEVRNNLAFCQILTGDISNGFKNAKKAIEFQYEPLYEMNKGVAEFLSGNVNESKQSLKDALQRLRSPESEFDQEVTCVLVLEAGGKEVSSSDDLPVDAAIVINLWRIGDLSRGDLEADLAKFYPEKAQSWLNGLNDP